MASHRALHGTWDLPVHQAPRLWQGHRMEPGEKGPGNPARKQSKASPQDRWGPFSVLMDQSQSSSTQCSATQTYLAH